MTAIECLRVVCWILTGLTTMIYFYRVVYLVVPLFYKKKQYAPASPLRYAVLIAARNEEAVLPHLLQSIRAQDYPAQYITTFVIADNCTDNTAAVAREYGATVYTRHSTTHIGKGYALDCLLEQIQEQIGLDQFDAFLVFDADNLLSADYIRTINALPNAGYQAFCGFRNTKNFGSNWISSAYGLWYLHESTHNNRSRNVLGVSGCINGTGFGFTRQLLEKLGGWHFYSLTEDLEFNNWCAVNGVKIGYCQEAVLYDEQPITFRQSWKQRIRWIQGGLQVTLKYGAKLLGEISKGKWQSYTCFEFFSITLWCVFLAAMSAGLSLLLAALTQTLPQFLLTLGMTLLSTYGSLLLIGVLATVLEWKNIYATTAQKLRAVVTFPLFMMTYLPVAIAAMFKKFQWEPIAHTVAISAEELTRMK